jgi:Tfp pilus assembly protein PilF
MRGKLSVDESAATIPPREAVAAELHRILRSQRFLNSEGLREFLRYIVEITLAGRGSELKESVIAIEAFHRQASFDPRLDAFVRVQAGRLRTALAEYYGAEGASDEVLIEVPKGSYTPVFSLHPAPAPAPLSHAAAPMRRPWPRLFSVLLPSVVFLAVLLSLFYWNWQRHTARLKENDIVVVADFENSTGDPVFNGAVRQALLADLDQSPFLNILGESRVQELRELMKWPAAQPLSGEVALELCRRAGGQAIIRGSISSMDRLYVIDFSVDNCASGDRLFSEQVRAEGKEQVLNAVDKAAARLRGRLGESLAIREKYSQPLESVTTPSLKALQAYSDGIAMRNEQGDASSIPFFLRAIELDPDFAMAYSQLGVIYWETMRQELAADNYRKAYALRSRVSQHERYYIESRYYHFVEADQEKSLAVYADWSREFPHDSAPRNGIAMIRTAFGDYEAAEAGFQDALRTDPSRAYLYTNLAEVLVCLKRPDEARAVLDQMRHKNLADSDQSLVGYQLAFLQGNTDEMRRQLSLAAGNDEAEEILLFYQAQTEASQGRMSEARRFIHQAMALASSLQAPDRGAFWQVQGALFEAEMGNTSFAREQVDAALKLSQSKDIRILAALAIARSGDPARAQELAAALRQQFPSDTILNNYWLPSITAAIDIDRKRPGDAIEALAVTQRYQLGQPSSFQIISIAPLYPVFLRGLAYKMAGKPAEAITQFQIVTSHPELVINYPLAALARQRLAQ